MLVDSVEVLNAVSRSLPFPVTGGSAVAEDTRLRFRFAPTLPGFPLELMILRAAGRETYGSLYPP